LFRVKKGTEGSVPDSFRWEEAYWKGEWSLDEADALQLSVSTKGVPASFFPGPYPRAQSILTQASRLTNEHGSSLKADWQADQEHPQILDVITPPPTAGLQKPTFRDDDPSWRRQQAAPRARPYRPIPPKRDHSIKALMGESHWLPTSLVHSKLRDAFEK